MADESSREKSSLDHWTMINSQGDIVGDAESETSESSIEILDMVAYQESGSDLSAREDHDGVVRIATSSSALTDQDSELESGKSDNDAQKHTDPSCEGYEEQPGTFLKTDEVEGHFNKSAEETADISETSSTSTELVGFVKQISSVEGSKVGLCQGLSLNDAAENCEELGAEKSGQDACGTDSPAIDVEGACCAELLQERISLIGESPASDEICKDGLEQAAGVDDDDDEGVDKGENDSDSDFVCLEPGVPKDLACVAYPEGREPSEERVMLPLRLSPANASVRQNFHFLPHPDYQDRIYEEGEEDGDDDTESSTEENIDDRIESEQSEAGSERQMNDIGDLSSFGDIGDLPLVAGNVARNYIHKPNQDLSTTLNTVIVLAAFLTMGLSLGIMMATDLEIEEWQTAYEVQSKRVADLEHQLTQQRVKFEQSSSLQSSVYTEMLEKAKLDLQKTQNEYLGYSRSLEMMSSYETEDPHFISVIQSVQSVVRSLSKCNTIGKAGWMKGTFCYMENQNLITQLKTELKDYSLASDQVKPEEAPADLDHREDIDADANVLIQDVKYETEQDGFDSIEEDVVSLIDLPTEPEEQSRGSIFLSLKDPEVIHEPSPQDGAEKREVGDTRGEAERPNGAEESNLMQDLPLSDLPAETELSDDKCPKEDHNHGDPGASLHAQSIPLDIRQLQQSLTREQQRALHWQQLYLAERRQREHERESELLEDQRDRERERIQEVECLHRLLTGNVTTITQVLTGLNISVYDDFANLSMLMSSVAELRKTVMNSVHKIGEGAEEIFHKIRQEGEETMGSVNWGKAMASKDAIIRYVNQLFHEVEKGVEYAFKEGDEKDIGDDKEEEKETIEEQDLFSFASDTDQTQEAEDHRMAKWVKGFQKFVQKTRKSISKFGKKLVSVVGRLGNIWTTKKPVLLSVTSNFSTKFLKVTEDFVKHVSKELRLKFFKHPQNSSKNDFTVHIQSDEVESVRKKWQRQVLHSPCDALGGYSAECNMNWREKKQGLKSVNKDFFSILKLKELFKNPQKIFARYGSQHMIKIMEKLELFLKEWKDSKFLLKTDLSWVQCQHQFWSMVLETSSKWTLMTENPCNMIQLCDTSTGGFERNNLKEQDLTGQSGTEVCFVANENKHEHDNEEESLPDSQSSSWCGDSSQAEGSTTVHVEPEDLDPIKLTSVEEEGSEEVNHTLAPESQLYSLPGPSRTTQHTSYKSRQIWKVSQTPQEPPVAKSQGVKEDDDADKDEILSSDWLFKKAEDRHHQREEAQRSLWLFERARDRRTNSGAHKSIFIQTQLSNDYNEEEDDDEEEEEEEEDQQELEQMLNWFLEQSRERQRLRKKEHESDWFFERASDRRKDHNLWKEHRKDRQERDSHNYHKKHSNKYNNDNKERQRKQHFRHSYGRVVTP